MNAKPGKSGRGKDFGKRIWLLFIDAEDNGNIPGWDWILGTKAFAAQLTEKPDAVVIVDMIGDTDLNIYHKRQSDARLTAEIWQTAARLKFDQFIDRPKYEILDDHIPFLERGIPAEEKRSPGSGDASPHPFAALLPPAW